MPRVSGKTVTRNKDTLAFDRQYRRMAARRWYSRPARVWEPFPSGLRERPHIIPRAPRGGTFVQNVRTSGSIGARQNRWNYYLLPVRLEFHLHDLLPICLKCVQQIREVRCDGGQVVVKGRELVRHMRVKGDEARIDFCVDGAEIIIKLRANAVQIRMDIVESGVVGVDYVPGQIVVAEMKSLIDGLRRDPDGIHNRARQTRVSTLAQGHNRFFARVLR